MPVTSASISFGRNALAISDDINTITVTHGGTGAYANTNDLKNIVAVQNRLITLETNFWLLDGQYKFAPNGSHFGYMSTALSDGSGIFAASVPQLSITFNNVYSTNELTLFFDQFSGDWCNSITIAFYNASSTLIRTDNYAPTSAIFKTAQAVASFKRIDISFNSSNKATRYVRLSCINFDDLVTFSGADIKSASLVEQIDPVCITLYSNTVEFIVHAANAGFSITNPSGFYANLRDNEPLDVYELVNENVVYLGRFYLDKWESLTENEASFHAYDILYQLENVKNNGHMFHPTLTNSVNTTFAGLLGIYIFPSFGIAWNVDPALGDPQMYGLTPTNGNLRRYLQSACFAIGGYATCSRSKKIQIRKTELASSLSVYDFTLTQADIGLKPKLNLLPLVTGIELTSRDYAVQTNAGYVPVTVFNQAVVVSQVVLLLFENPTYNWTAGTGNTATVSNVGTANYINGTCTVAGTWVLNVSEFVEGKNLYTQYTGGLPAGTAPNVVKIEDEKLISSHNGSAVLSLLYNYYQQRYRQTVKLFAPSVTPGDSVYMDTQSDKHLAGIVERMETDLVNGFVATCDVVGVVI